MYPPGRARLMNDRNITPPLQQRCPQRYEARVPCLAQLSLLAFQLYMPAAQDFRA